MRWQWHCLALLGALCIAGLSWAQVESPYAVHGPAVTRPADEALRAAAPPVMGMTINFDQVAERTRQREQQQDASANGVGRSEAAQDNAIPSLDTTPLEDILPIAKGEPAVTKEGRHKHRLHAPWRLSWPHKHSQSKELMEVPNTQAADERGALGWAPKPRRSTQEVAQQAVEMVSAHFSGILHVVDHIQEVSHNRTVELMSQLQAVQQLHRQVVEAGTEEARIAAGLVETLGTQTAAKMNATTSLDLDAAARLQDDMEHSWAQLAAAHVREMQALEDADKLADVALSLHMALAEEQGDLAEAVQAVAAALSHTAGQLQQIALQLHDQATTHMGKKANLTQQATEAGSGLAVRRELAELTGQALKVLQQSGQQLEDTRLQFQEVWRHQLVSHQEAALTEALTATASAQLQDLTWRRDMALAADAYAEAEATQATLDRLQEVQQALVQHAVADLRAGLTHSGDAEACTTTTCTTDVEPAAAAGGHAASCTTTTCTSEGVESVQDKKLSEALQAYHTQLAAQRDASTTLAHLEILRQKLILGQVSPGRARSELLKIKPKLLTAECCR